MNKEYVYRENDVLVHTDTELVSREYVDNIEGILETENNIENLENKIKILEKILHRKNAARIAGKFSSIAVIVLCLCVAIAAFPTVFWAALMTFIVGGMVGGLGIALVVGEDVRKKTIEKLKNRISVSKYELEQEKQDLNILKKESKKIDIPNNKEIKELSTTYTIRNLRHKLSIVQMFEENKERFIEMYQNGDKYDILKELSNKYSDRYTNFDFELIKFLIDEHTKQQEENSKGYVKRMNKH